MKHPTKAQVQVVIDNLTKVLPMAANECNLDMMQGDICGTIHCHGGWYFLSKVDNPEVYNTYLDGAALMAQDLGFDREMKLTRWAQNNSDIWGNTSGPYMFSSRMAFSSPTRPDGALNLQHIVDHWREVQSRLPE
jgi:hypothetical protein